MNGMEYLKAPPLERVVLLAIYDRRRRRLEEQAKAAKRG